MTAYRAGQRVRVVTELEGVVLPNEDYDQILYVRSDSGRHGTYVLDDDGFTTTVTVLSEPRPDEPTGLGAVVEASHAILNDNASFWVRLPADDADGHGVWHDGEFSTTWGDLIDPVVLSEGWTQ